MDGPRVVDPSRLRLRVHPKRFRAYCRGHTPLIKEYKVPLRLRLGKRVQEFFHSPGLLPFSQIRARIERYTLKGIEHSCVL